MVIQLLLETENRVHKTTDCIFEPFMTTELNKDY